MDQANAIVEACTANPELPVVHVAKIVANLYAAGYVIVSKDDVVDTEFARTLEGE